MKSMKRNILLLLFWLMAGTVTQALELTSPNGQYVVSIEGMSYTVKFAGRTIIEPSQLGIDVDNRLFESALGVPRGEHLDWCADMVLKGEERLSRDTTWMPLYGALDNRLMKGYEYMSRSNLGFDVPFTCWKDLTGRYHNWQVLAEGALGQWRAVFEIAYNHYVGRRHLQMPYTSLALGHYVRPEGAGFTCDNPGFGTLLFYRGTKVDNKGEVPEPRRYKMNEKRTYSASDEPVIRMEDAPGLTLVRNVDCWPEYWDLKPVRQNGNQYEYEPLGAKSRNGYTFEADKMTTTFIVFEKCMNNPQ